jgi:hypothetical protein
MVSCQETAIYIGRALLVITEVQRTGCSAWQDALSRVHHANNFREVSVCLFKELFFSSVKAYKIIASLLQCPRDRHIAKYFRTLKRARP